MVQRITPVVDSLYDTDETAWLEVTAEFIRLGQWENVDATHLAEYLDDMARRDKREVLSRLGVLIAHLLKWRHQPDRRTRSWQETVEVQRQELAELLESGTLRNYAEETLGKAYTNGVRQFVAETGLLENSVPNECESSLDEVLAAPLDE